MASTFSNLGLELQATGENANTWGDKTNTNLSMIDERLSEIHTITSTSTSQTISAPTDGTSGQTTRYATLKYTGSASSAITVTLPASVKIVYNVINGTGQTITFQNSTTTTVATIPNGENSIIHSDGSANVYKIGGTSNFETDITVKTSDGGLLTLQTSDTSVTDGDVLGALQFQAPNEGSGTDAITVAASIVAEADNTFAADNNQTDMVFKLGGTSAATEKMRLTHEGDLEFKVDGFDLLFGADGDVNLRHVADTGLLLNSTRQLQFGDSGTYIHQSADGVLDLVSDTEIEINATTIDVNGNLDVSGSITLGGTAITSTAAELNILDGVTATATELNIIDGVTATTAELNILDGVTATATELNIMDGVTSTTAELNILDGVTSSTDELNKLDGIISTTAELNILNGVTSTTAELNILDGVTATASELNIMDGVTATASELNIMDGVTATTVELNILDGVTSTASELNLVDGITAGTVSASKAVIVDSNKDITGFRNITNTGTITTGGAITASGNITAFSDERLKSDIQTIDNALDKVMNMRGVSYTKQAEKGIGVIAQEVEKVLPEVVTDGEFKSVAYGNMVGVLIEAIKDLKQELDEHKEGCNCK